MFFFFFSSRRRHTRCSRDWSSDVCSSDLLSANALAKAGHTVYATMRDTAGRNAPQVADVKKFAHDNTVDMRPIELDVSSETSIEAAIRQIVAEQSRLDVLMHNAGHMAFGPADAISPEQMAEL